MRKLKLIEEYDKLPWQHLVFFEQDEKKDGKKSRSH